MFRAQDLTFWLLVLLALSTSFSLIDCRMPDGLKSDDVATRAEVAGSKDSTDILFRPPSLDFKEKPMCVSSLSTVEILNRSDRDDLQILSVSTDNLHFHPSVAKDMVAGPGERLSINVIFLPRTPGKIEAFMVLHTNLGSFVYHLQGKGIENEYKVRPMLGHKLPVDVAYWKPLVLHNPHSDTLHVREVYTTEGFLTLRLPDQSGTTNSVPSASQFPSTAFPQTAGGGGGGGGGGSPDGSGAFPPFVLDAEGQLLSTENNGGGGGGANGNSNNNPTDSSDVQFSKFWEIPPHQSKTIIYLNFIAHQPGKYHGFVHVKTDKDNLIVHVEFLVTKSGVHKLIDELDFGTIVSQTETVSRDIFLLNSGTTPFSVNDIYSSVSDLSLSIRYKKGSLLPPGTATSVATVSYSGKSQGSFSGKIMIRTNDSITANSRIEIPYRARVLHGTLEYMLSNTTFFIGSLIRPLPNVSSSSASPASLLTFDPSLPFLDEKDMRSAGFEPASSFDAPQSPTASPTSSETSILFTAPVFLKNGFSVPVQFLTADVPDKHFELFNFRSGLIIQPGETSHVLSLRFRALNQSPNFSYSLKDLIRATNLTMDTNITKVYVPLRCFHGRLQYTSSDHFASVFIHQQQQQQPSSKPGSVYKDTDHALKSVFKDTLLGKDIPVRTDLGMLSPGEEREHRFLLTNPNPIPVAVLGWESDVQGLDLQFEKITKTFGGLSTSSFFPPITLTELDTLLGPFSGSDGGHAMRSPLARDLDEDGVLIEGIRLEDQQEYLSRVLSSIHNNVNPATTTDIFPTKSAAKNSGSTTFKFNSSRGGGSGKDGVGMVVILEHGESASFVARVKANETDGERVGRIRFSTSFSGTLDLAIQYMVDSGSLSFTFPRPINFSSTHHQASQAQDPENTGSVYKDTPLVFGTSFPGRVSRQPLSIVSSFSRLMKVSNVLVEDERFVPVITGNLLEPNQQTEVGYLLFDPLRSPFTSAYLSPFPLPMPAPSPLTLSDLELYRSRVSTYENMTQHSEHCVSTPIHILTSSMKQSSGLAHAQLSFPSVVRIRELEFNTTRIGSTSSAFLELQNPSDFPISIQLFHMKTSGGSGGAAVPFKSMQDLYFQTSCHKFQSHTPPCAFDTPHSSAAFRPRRRTPLTDDDTDPLILCHYFLEEYGCSTDLSSKIMSVNFSELCPNYLLTNSQVGSTTATAPPQQGASSNLGSFANFLDRLKQAFEHSSFSVPVVPSFKFAQPGISPSSPFSLPDDLGDKIFTLPPHTTAKFGPIRFTPTTTSSFHSVFYVKNNLSIFDVVDVFGQGGSGRLVFFASKEDAAVDSWPISSAAASQGGGVFKDTFSSQGLDSLVIDITESHILQALQISSEKSVEQDNSQPQVSGIHDSGSTLEAPPSPALTIWERLMQQFSPEQKGSAITITRVFRAHNKGNLPLHIEKFSMDGLGCSAFGISVLPCSTTATVFANSEGAADQTKPPASLVLQPGENITLTLLYRPDFTNAATKTNLMVHTPQAIVSYPLTFTIPAEILPKYAALQPSAPVERALRRVLVLIAVLVGIYLAAVAWLELASIGRNSARNLAAPSTADPASQPSNAGLNPSSILPTTTATGGSTTSPPPPPRRTSSGTKSAADLPPLPMPARRISGGGPSDSVPPSKTFVISGMPSSGNAGGLSGGAGGAVGTNGGTNGLLNSIAGSSPKAAAAWRLQEMLTHDLKISPSSALNPSSLNPHTHRLSASSPTTTTSQPPLASAATTNANGSASSLPYKQVGSLTPASLAATATINGGSGNGGTTHTVSATIREPQDTQALIDSLLSSVKFQQAQQGETGSGNGGSSGGGSLVLQLTVSKKPENGSKDASAPSDKKGDHKRTNSGGSGDSKTGGSIVLSFSVPVRSATATTPTTTTAASTTPTTTKAAAVEPSKTTNVSKDTSSKQSAATQSGKPKTDISRSESVSPPPPAPTPVEPSKKPSSTSDQSDSTKVSSKTATAPSVSAPTTTPTTANDQSSAKPTSGKTVEKDTKPSGKEKEKTPAVTTSSQPQTSGKASKKKEAAKTPKPTSDEPQTAAPTPAPPAVTPTPATPVPIQPAPTTPTQPPAQPEKPQQGKKGKQTATATATTKKTLTASKTTSVAAVQQTNAAAASSTPVPPTPAPVTIQTPSASVGDSTSATTVESASSESVQQTSSEKLVENSISEKETSVKSESAAQKKESNEAQDSTSAAATTSTNAAPTEQPQTDKQTSKTNEKISASESESSVSSADAVRASDVSTTDAKQQPEEKTKEKPIETTVVAQQQQQQPAATQHSGSSKSKKNKQKQTLAQFVSKMEELESKEKQLSTELQSKDAQTPALPKSASPLEQSVAPMPSVVPSLPLPLASAATNGQSTTLSPRSSEPTASIPSPSHTPPVPLQTSVELAANERNTSTPSPKNATGVQTGQIATASPAKKPTANSPQPLPPAATTASVAPSKDVTSGTSASSSGSKKSKKGKSAAAPISSPEQPIPVVEVNLTSPSKEPATTKGNKAPAQPPSSASPLSPSPPPPAVGNLSTATITPERAEEAGRKRDAKRGSLSSGVSSPDGLDPSLMSALLPVGMQMGTGAPFSSSPPPPTQSSLSSNGSIAGSYSLLNAARSWTPTIDPLIPARPRAQEPDASSSGSGSGSYSLFSVDLLPGALGGIGQQPQQHVPPTPSYSLYGLPSDNVYDAQSPPQHSLWSGMSSPPTATSAQPATSSLFSFPVASSASAQPSLYSGQQARAPAFIQPSSAQTAVGAQQSGSSSFFSFFGEERGVQATAGRMSPAGWGQPDPSNLGLLSGIPRSVTSPNLQPLSSAPGPIPTAASLGVGAVGSSFGGFPSYSSAVPQFGSHLLVPQTSANTTSAVGSTSPPSVGIHLLRPNLSIGGASASLMAPQSSSFFSSSPTSVHARRGQMSSGGQAPQLFFDSPPDSPEFRAEDFLGPDDLPSAPIDENEN